MGPHIQTNACDSFLPWFYPPLSSRLYIPWYPMKILWKSSNPHDNPIVFIKNPDFSQPQRRPCFRRRSNCSIRARRCSCEGGASGEGGFASSSAGLETPQDVSVGFPLVSPTLALPRCARAARRRFPASGSLWPARRVDRSAAPGLASEGKHSYLVVLPISSLSLCLFFFFFSFLSFYIYLCCISV